MRTLATTHFLQAALLGAALSLVACLPAAPAAPPPRGATPAPVARATSPTAPSSGAASTPTIVPPPAALPPPAATPAVSAPGATTVIVFHSTDGTGPEIEGYCWVRSLSVWRPGAWRCMAGNQINDPCFSNTDEDTYVICLRDPTGEGRGVKMKLTKPLPARERLPQGQHAWVLELADGAKCGFLQGATGGIGGKRLNYGCSGGWYILGDLETGQIWRAEKVRLAAGRMEAEESVQVEIRTVWL